jgi:thioredoxin reductase (NADPH)
MSAETYKADVAVIGAGPAGLFAVFECGMLGFSCHVVDALPDIGGQCTALYPEKPIYDIPGCPSILAGELVENLERQAAPFKPVYHLSQKVVSISDNDGSLSVITSANTRIQARAVIIAAGAGAFGPNRPPLDGLEAYENKSVFYAVRRKADFAGKNIVIAGGGDSAVDWTLSLYEAAQSLTLVHRRAKFRAAPESVRQLEHLVGLGHVRLAVPAQLDSLSGTDGVLKAVRVRYDDDVCEDIQADILLPFYGLSNDMGALSDWNIVMEGGHIKVEAHDCATSRPGIYAIGDIVSYKDKLKLILTGFAEAAQAAHAIYRQIYPDTPLHAEYSTTKGLPTL